MNTIRFFLLLISLFLFAFLIQKQHSPSSVPEVLSEKSRASSVQSSDLKYRYPDAKLENMTDTSETFSTEDDLGVVVDWYYQKLLHETYAKKIPFGKDQVFVLSAVINNEKIVARIERKTKDQKVFIVLAVSPS